MNGWQVVLAVLLLARLSDARFNIWSLDSQEEENSEPDFCRGAPCPPYKLISKGSTYELREYTQSKFSIYPRSALMFAKTTVSKCVHYYNVMKYRCTACSHLDCNEYFVWKF